MPGAVPAEATICLVYYLDGRCAVGPTTEGLYVLRPVGGGLFSEKWGPRFPRGWYGVEAARRAIGSPYL